MCTYVPMRQIGGEEITEQNVRLHNVPGKGDEEIDLGVT